MKRLAAQPATLHVSQPFLLIINHPPSTSPAAGIDTLVTVAPDGRAAQTGLLALDVPAIKQPADEVSYRQAAVVLQT